MDSTNPTDELGNADESDIVDNADPGASSKASTIFRLDRSKITRSSLLDQVPLLAQIGVTAYDQETFEVGVLEQVDEALRNSTGSEIPLKPGNVERESVDPAVSLGESSSITSTSISAVPDQIQRREIRPFDIIRNSDFREPISTRTEAATSQKEEEQQKDEIEEENEIGVASSGSEYIPSGSEEEGENELDDDEATTSNANDNGKKGRRKRKSEKEGKERRSSLPLVPGLKDDGSENEYQKRLKEWKTKQLHDRLVKAAQMQNEDTSNSEDLEEAIELTGGLKIPAFLWNQLYGYQKTGVRWLWDLHCQAVGGIIGDEMGLGKTIQIIVFLAALDYSKLPAVSTDRPGLGSILIICPTTVMHQWVCEFHRWWPPVRVVVMHDSGSYSGSRASLIRLIMTQGGVLITSYSTMTMERDLLTKFEWHYVILDEGHKIRNPDARVTVTAKRFPTPHRLILSGTPMQNSLKELWSLFDFVFPGRLGALPVFLREFGVPITQGGYANATEIQVRTAYRCACVLRDVISPYLLRRMKADVQQIVHLPSKNEQVLFCRLTDDQRHLYRLYLQSRECESILKGSLEVFVGLIALRKLCNHPDLVTGGPNRLDDLDESDDPSNSYGFAGRSGKLTVVEALLKLWKAQGHRVLLFSQSKQMLNILEKFVQIQNYVYLRMDGGTAIGSRQKLVAQFNGESTIFVFLLTTRVGGLGLNLIGADRVLIFDPDWNPSTDAQARERVWRIGQQKPVTIYRLLTTGTIEEKIYHRQIFKQFLTNRVLKDPRQRRFFKTNDLYELFTLTDDQNGNGTESGSLFAGTGSEINKAPSKRKRKYVKTEANIFDQLAEEREKRLKKRKIDSNESGKEKSDQVEEDDIDFVPESTKEESRRLSDERKKQLRELAKSINRRFSTESGSGVKQKRRSKKDKKFEGVRIPNLDSQCDFQPPGSGGDVDRVDEASNRNQDDYVLRKLFKKSGVKSALRHDKIVNDSEADYLLVEAEAESVARHAAEALEASRRLAQSSSDYGIMTWTGRHGEAGRIGGGGLASRPRFGPKSRRSKAGDTGQRRKSTSDTTSSRPLFSGLKKQQSSEEMSSTNLLTQIRNRRKISDPNSDQNGDQNGKSTLADCVPRFQQLMDELRLFLVLGGKNADGRATTEEILAKFGNRIPNQDSFVFRSMLKKICDFNRTPDGKGLWSLKTQFR